MRKLSFRFVLFGLGALSLFACSQYPIQKKEPAPSFYALSHEQQRFVKLDAQGRSLLAIPPRLVLKLKNQSDRPVLVDFNSHEGGMKAGLASKIDPGCYNILDQGSNAPLLLACFFVKADGQLQKTDCHQKILISGASGHYSRESGIYWVAENQ